MEKITSSEPISVCVTVLSQMFLYLRSLDIDVDEFLRSIHVDPESVKAPDSRIPIDKYLHIQESAAEFTHDACFGLHMGEYAEPGSWSILGYLMMNCRTLGEAMEKSGRYSRVIGNLIEATPHLQFNKIKFVFHTPAYAPQMSRHCFEATFSSLVRMVRSLTGINLCPWEVTFIYPPPGSSEESPRLFGIPMDSDRVKKTTSTSIPGSLSEYTRVFGCPVYFGQRENSMTIDLSFAKIPILMANDGLKDYFEQYAREIIAQLDHQNEFTSAVTKMVLANLDDESLTIQKVARQMAVSVRTLQNRLEDEGVIFSDLLKDIRERLAKKYLKENYTVEQITYLLGFSEPSVFRKAFKKWSGVTPREFREGAYSVAN